MKSDPNPAVERSMKVQPVILKTICRQLPWWQAAEISGISGHSMRRRKERYQQHAYNGLFDHRAIVSAPRSCCWPPQNKSCGFTANHTGTSTLRISPIRCATSTASA